VGFKEIICNGGETPDKHVAMVAHRFGKVMAIRDERDSDDTTVMDVTEAKFVPLELIMAENSFSARKTQKATKREVEALASYIFRQIVVIEQEL
jgi:hypothetical protein